MMTRLDLRAFVFDEVTVAVRDCDHYFASEAIEAVSETESRLTTVSVRSVVEDIELGVVSGIRWTDGVGIGKGGAVA